MAKSPEESAIYQEIMKLSDPSYLGEALYGLIPSFPLGAESATQRQPTLAESLSSQVYGPQLNRVSATPPESEILRAAAEQKAKEAEADLKAQEALAKSLAIGEAEQRREDRQAREVEKIAQTIRKAIKGGRKSDLYVARGDSIRKIEAGEDVRARGKPLDTSRGSYSKVKMTTSFDRIQREAEKRALEEQKKQLQLLASFGLDASGRPLTSKRADLDPSTVMANLAKAAVKLGLNPEDLLTAFSGRSPEIALMSALRKQRQLKSK